MPPALGRRRIAGVRWRPVAGPPVAARECRGGRGPETMGLEYIVETQEARARTICVNRLPMAPPPWRKSPVPQAQAARLAPCHPPASSPSTPSARADEAIIHPPEGLLNSRANFLD